MYSETIKKKTKFEICRGYGSNVGALSCFDVILQIPFFLFSILMYEDGESTKILGTRKDIREIILMETAT
jgi:hypothetical protein